MDWEIVFSRFHDVLVPDGQVAIITRHEQAPPWYEAQMELITRYSVYQNYESFALVEQLSGHHVFAETGHRRFGPVTHRQSVEDYILSWHSRGGMARGKMPPEDIEAFDSGLRAVVTPYAEDGMLTLQTEAQIVWGRPLSG